MKQLTEEEIFIPGATLKAVKIDPNDPEINEQIGKTLEEISKIPQPVRIPYW